MAVDKILEAQNHEIQHLSLAKTFKWNLHAQNDTKCFTGYHFNDQALRHTNESTTSCVRAEKANTSTRRPLELLENVTDEQNQPRQPV